MSSYCSECGAFLEDDEQCIGCSDVSNDYNISIVDYFQPENDVHIAAWKDLNTNGLWSPMFLNILEKDKVKMCINLIQQSGTTWQPALDYKIAKYFVEKYTNMIKEKINKGAQQITTRKYIWTDESFQKLVCTIKRLESELKGFKEKQ